MIHFRTAVDPKIPEYYLEKANETHPKKLIQYDPNDISEKARDSFRVAQEPRSTNYLKATLGAGFIFGAVGISKSTPRWIPISCFIAGLGLLGVESLKILVRKQFLKEAFVHIEKKDSKQAIEAIAQGVNIFVEQRKTSQCFTLPVLNSNGEKLFLAACKQKLKPVIHYLQNLYFHAFNAWIDKFKTDPEYRDIEMAQLCLRYDRSLCNNFFNIARDLADVDPQWLKIALTEMREVGKYFNGQEMSNYFLTTAQSALFKTDGNEEYLRFNQAEQIIAIFDCLGLPTSTINFRTMNKETFKEILSNASVEFADPEIDALLNVFKGKPVSSWPLKILLRRRI